MKTMDRREAIRHVTLLLGGSVIGASSFLEGCVSEVLSTNVESLFDKKNIKLLNELAEAILPRTSTPGAKDANVGAFIPVMIRDCYNPVDQDIFVEGFAGIDERAQLNFGKKYLKLNEEERLQFVHAFDIEAEESQKTGSNHFFTMLKQMTLLGFFTSEIGMTQALRYVKIPGRYDGDYPYKKGDRAFA